MLSKFFADIFNPHAESLYYLTFGTALLVLGLSFIPDPDFALISVCFGLGIDATVLVRSFVITCL